MASCELNAACDAATAMWVALSEGSVFSIYPQLLEELFLQEEDERARSGGEAAAEVERLVLPSDREWRLKQYFKLVSLQRTCSDDMSEDEEREKQEEDVGDVWCPWQYIVPLDAVRTSARAPVNVKSQPTPEWDVEEVVKAARLLCKPPLPTQFQDEQEMRRVYSVVYDVFRYKTILSQTLEDVGFFRDFSQGLVKKNIKKNISCDNTFEHSMLLLTAQATSFDTQLQKHARHPHVVWLFVMELARRCWSARPRDTAARAATLLAEAGENFTDIERDVWSQRVHFAAAVSRIRIKNKAFSMAELLPPHLRDDRVSPCVSKDLITGWVNMIKAKNVKSLIKRLKEMGYTYSSSKQLCALEYRFDRVCSRFITLRLPPKTSIVSNDLVREGIIILQEREFCEGAAVLCSALRKCALRGHIAQTHATSPRSTAYLAGQLRELAAANRAAAAAANKLAVNSLASATPDIGRLAAHYVQSLREMGIEANSAPHFSGAVCVVGEPVHMDHPNVSAALDGVVAALATPPNSYSAVTDPIDLVCGRGGDLAMLEVLTESEIDGDGKKRVQTILEEQKRTLKFLMSKPQIQLVLYETHSALEAENDAMVKRAISESNRLARERHALLRRKNPHHTPDFASFPVTIQTPKLTPHTEPTKPVTIAELSNSEPENSNMHVESSSENDRTENAKGAKTDVLNKRPGTSGSRPGSSATTGKTRPIPDLEILDASTARTPRDPDDDCADIYVPKCDLFEVQRLPNLGNGLDIKYILERDGCYLSLIQRKEITRLDAKYMIKVAEERGLFGGAMKSAPTTTSNANKKIKKDTNKRKHRGGGFEVERISAPTHASLSRTRRLSAPAGFNTSADSDEEDSFRLCCSRHEKRQAAAAANAAFSCSCDANHKRRRPSLELPPMGRHALPPSCRTPFPVCVHDVRLQIYDEIVTCRHRPMTESR